MDKSAQTDGGPVLLTGFDPLTTDVLSRILTRRGFDIQARSEPGAADPALLILGVETVTISRLDDTRNAWPDVPVVAVVSVAGGSVRQAARRVGAAAVVTRSQGIDAFVHAVRVAIDGGTINPGDAARDDPLSGLTERETAVLGLVARGASNADIGDTLGISPHTARTHVQNVMAKLGVRNRAGRLSRGAGRRTHPPGDSMNPARLVVADDDRLAGAALAELLQDEAGFASVTLCATSGMLSDVLLTRRLRPRSPRRHARPRQNRGALP